MTVKMKKMEVAVHSIIMSVKIGLKISSSPRKNNRYPSIRTIIIIKKAARISQLMMKTSIPSINIKIRDNYVTRTPLISKDTV